MLVLSRKAEESMYIGDDIKITVLDIRGAVSYTHLTLQTILLV